MNNGFEVQMNTVMGENQRSNFVSAQPVPMSNAGLSLGQLLEFLEKPKYMAMYSREDKEVIGDIRQMLQRSASGNTTVKISANNMVGSNLRLDSSIRDLIGMANCNQHGDLVGPPGLYLRFDETGSGGYNP